MHTFGQSTQGRGRGAVTQLVEALRYKPEGRGFDYRLSNYGRRADSASDINEYQDYFLGW